MEGRNYLSLIINNLFCHPGIIVPWTTSNLALIASYSFLCALAFSQSKLSFKKMITPYYNIKNHKMLQQSPYMLIDTSCTCTMISGKEWKYWTKLKSFHTILLNFKPQCSINLHSLSSIIQFISATSNITQNIHVVALFLFKFT